MKKKNISESVAINMDKIINSDSHTNMFYKKAEVKDIVEEIPDQLTNIFDVLVNVSAELDNHGLEKSSEKVLNSVSTLMIEAAARALYEGVGLQESSMIPLIEAIKNNPSLTAYILSRLSDNAVQELYKDKDAAAALSAFRRELLEREDIETIPKSEDERLQEMEDDAVAREVAELAGSEPLPKEEEEIEVILEGLEDEPPEEITGESLLRSDEPEEEGEYIEISPVEPREEEGPDAPEYEDEE